MRLLKYSLMPLITAASLLGLSCGKKDDKKDTATATTATKSAAISGASDVGDLKLSGALKIAVPASVAATASSLALVNTEKSREACELRQTIREGMQTLQSVGSMFCHLEVEGDSMKAGKKYKIQLTGSETSTMAIWMDNSHTDKIRVYMCNNGKTLSEVIEISAVKDGKAKGYVISKGGESTQAWHSLTFFDAGYTNASITKLLSKQIFTDSASNGSFRRALKLVLNSSGVSTVISSNAGTWGGSTFANRGAAKINGTHGMTLYNGKGTDPQSRQGYEYFSKDWFDKTGTRVASSASSDFSGALAVTDADVPKFLPADFSVTDPSGWDCSTEETITIAMTGAKEASHNACDVDNDNLNTENCWGSLYTNSAESHSADSSVNYDIEKDSDL